MPVLLAEQRLVQVPVRPIARGHRIGDCDPGGDLDALDGVHDQKPQLAVEDVQVQDGVEGHPVAEGVGRQGGIIALERQGIAAQAVVTDEPQVVERLSPVGNLKAPLDQAVELLVEGERRFVEPGLLVFFRHKKPALVRRSDERRGGCCYPIFSTSRRKNQGKLSKDPSFLGLSRSKIYYKKG